jgi:large conductance mechanosensitive channel
MKGDVLSLATAVIGGAFGKIINSLVEDVIMPIVGLLTGGVDFTQKFIALDGGHYDTLDAAKEWGLPLSPMVIYCRRLLILLLHCLFF